MIRGKAASRKAKDFFANSSPRSKAATAAPSSQDNFEDEMSPPATRAGAERLTSGKRRVVSLRRRSATRCALSGGCRAPVSAV